MHQLAFRPRRRYNMMQAFSIQTGPPTIDKGLFPDLVLLKCTSQGTLTQFTGCDKVNKGQGHGHDPHLGVTNPLCRSRRHRRHCAPTPMHESIKVQPRLINDVSFKNVNSIILIKKLSQPLHRPLCFRSSQSMFSCRHHHHCHCRCHLLSLDVVDIK